MTARITLKDTVEVTSALKAAVFVNLPLFLLVRLVIKFENFILVLQYLWIYDHFHNRGRRHFLSIRLPRFIVVQGGHVLICPRG